MKNFKIEGIKTLSKPDQKIIAGGDHPLCCYKACVNSGNSSELCQNVCYF